MSVSRPTESHVWLMNAQEDAALRVLIYELERYVRLDVMAPNHADTLRNMQKELFS